MAVRLPQPHHDLPEEGEAIAATEQLDEGLDGRTAGWREDDEDTGEQAQRGDQAQHAARTTRSRRPMVAGAIAGMWAFLVGVGVVTCLVMLAWAVSPNSAGDAGAAWRAAGLTWLGAHLVPLQLGEDPLTLLPLGALLLGLLLTRRAGAWTGRLLPSPTPREVGWLAAGAGLLYGAGGAAVAWLSAAEGAAAEPARAALVTALIAALGTVWGIAPEAGLLDAVRARMPDAMWRTLAAGLAAVLGLVAVGAAFVAFSLIRHFADAGATLAALDAGGLGAAGITLLGALSLPDLAIWAASVTVGPGFSLGSVGSLSAFGGEVGTLPALPVLAAIPTTMPGWAPALLVLPVLLGVLAGRIRWGRDLPTAVGALTGALALGGVVAVLLAVLFAVTEGSLGSGRLAQVGPLIWPGVAAGTGLVVLGFLLEAATQSARLSWELHRAEARAAAERDAEAPAPSQEVLAAAEADEDGSAEWTEGLSAAEDPESSRQSQRRMSVAGAAASISGVVLGAGGLGKDAVTRGVGAVGARGAALASSAGSVVTGAASALLHSQEDADAPAEATSVVDVRDDGEQVVDLRGPEEVDGADEPAERSEVGAADEPDGEDELPEASGVEETDERESGEGATTSIDVEADQAVAEVAGDAPESPCEVTAEVGDEANEAPESPMDHAPAAPAAPVEDDDTAEIPIVRAMPTGAFTD